MANTNVKYWVSDLSEKAQQVLLKKIETNLTSEGHDSEVIETYLEDVKDEKLGNLDYHVSYDEMVELSSME